MSNEDDDEITSMIKLLVSRRSVEQASERLCRSANQLKLKAKDKCGLMVIAGCCDR